MLYRSCLLGRVAGALAAGGAATTCAADVIGEGFATDLVGAIASVSFAVQTGPSSFAVFSEGATIVPGATPGSVIAQTSGVFEWEKEEYTWGFRLDLSGPTETSPWSLTSTGTDQRVYIVGLILDSFPKPTSGALFDDGSVPSTPGSGPGSPNALTVSGPPVFATAYDPGYLWPHPSNAGDMYTSVLVQWAELTNHKVFGIGMTAQWLLDTDAIPAPGAVAVLGLGALVFIRRTRAGLRAPGATARRTRRLQASPVRASTAKVASQCSPA